MLAHLCRRHSAIAILALLIAKSAHGMTCKQIFSEMPRESVVELELPVNENTLLLMTTTDGTLNPLLTGIAQISHRSSVLRPILMGREPRQVLWSSLSPLQKKRVVEIALKTQRSFLEQRRIEGLQIKPEIQTRWGLASEVEMRGPSDLEKWAGVELHRSVQGLASENLIQSRRLMEQSGVPPQQHDVHVHLLARFPRDALIDRPLLTASKVVNYLQRVETFSQMVSVVEAEIPISTNETTVAGRGDEPAYNSTNMAPLDSYKIEEAFTALYDAGTNSAKIPLIATKGWSGFKGPGFYRDQDLFGSEFRAASAKIASDRLGPILDGIHASIEDPDFGLAPNQIESWLESVVTGDETQRYWIYFRVETPSLERRIYSTLPRGTELFTYGLASVVTLLDFDPRASQLWRVYVRSLGSEPIKQLRFIARNRREIDFLLHPWEIDPILYNHADILKRIDHARIHALRELIRGKPVTRTVRNFLVESGLYQSYGLSLSIETL